MQLGHFAIPYTVLLLFVTTSLSFALASYFDRRGAQKIEPSIVRMFMVAVVAARLFFVWRYWSLYLQSPWTILDIRDGGWDAQAGIIGAWVYALTAGRQLLAARKPFAWTVGVASVVWLAGSLAIYMNTELKGSMPALALQDLNGGQVSLADFKGRPTVVNIWATWCPPCQKEMPAMALVQARRPDVNFVFVDQGESKEEVNDYLAAGRLQLKNVLLDHARVVARDFSVIGTPTTLFFDASGKLAYQHVGALSEAALTRRLEEISGPARERAAARSQ